MKGERLVLFWVWYSLPGLTLVFVYYPYTIPGMTIRINVP